MRRILLVLAAVFSVSPSWGQAPAASSRISLEPSASQPHAFDVDIEASRPFGIASARVVSGDETWGRYSEILDPPVSSLALCTPNFRYIPAKYSVVVELDRDGEIESKTFGPFSRPMLKMILVDRDGYPQQAICLEGDRWFPFGRLALSSEVSTGKPKYGGTPLGYYHVRNKESFARNALQEWDMPFAHWYTPTTYPEGVNGLHEGFEGTNYGIPQSHGCTRMQPWFARALFQWSELKSPVIYMGNSYITAYDRGRFDTADYETFRALVRDVVLYHQALHSGLERPTYFSRDETLLIERMQPFFQSILQSCEEFRRFSQGAALAEIVEQYAVLRGVE
ncbi:MAG: hypothetical protein BWZ10_01036 [candidate division BRC1 bacterium ADurb.BinA364]|nr:MAG: hypothetical protein BWZ10_01036 [candidate division BRC1 bacterium ADurb.BinA364]